MKLEETIKPVVVESMSMAVCGQADDNVAGLGQIFCLERLRCVKHAEVLLGDTAIGVNGTKCKKVIAVRCGLSGLFAR